MADERQSVLIGIPSFRRPEGLRKLLSSLAVQQGTASLAVAIFVADSDARDSEAVEVVRKIAADFPWPLRCEIVAEPGISAARNAILDEARNSQCDFLAMIDDDEVANEDWLIRLLESAERYQADVVGGPVYFDFEREPSASIRQCGIFDVPPWKEGPISVLYATGNLLIRTEIMDRAGWPRFDSSFGLTGGEDGEFLRRLRARGARLAWAPKAIARESVPTTRINLSWVLRRSFRKGNINFRIEQLHGGRSGAALSLTKAIVLLGSAPVSIILLLVPSRRLWILGKWSQSFGKFAGAIGRRYAAYGQAEPAGSSH